MYNEGSIPNALILDTNVLVYLFDPERNEDELFRRLIALLMDRRVKLVIPEQVKKEWDKHKREKNDQYLKQTRKAIENHRSLVDHFDTEQEKTELLSKLDRLQIMAERQYRYTHGLRARNLNEFIEDTYYTDIPTRNAIVDSLIINMSLERKAPFFTFNSESGSKKASKNEMADAIIFFTACNYAKNNINEFEHIYFVSENGKDFSAGNNSLLHGNLRAYADEAKIEFNNNLRRTLDIIDPQKSSIIAPQQDVKYYMNSNMFTNCEGCQGEVHINADCKTIISPKYPQGEYVLVCPQCEHVNHTGETYLDLYN